MIRESLLRLIYEAAGMQRWNDHIRPHKGFTELDKQSHKFFYAYVIGRFEEDSGSPVKWMELIEGAIFEFFHRLLLTDIKPPIFHTLMERHGSELNRLVLEALEERGIFELEGGLGDRLKEYLSDAEYSQHEKRILRASHYLATSWEFDIVYRLSEGFYGLEETRRSIEGQIEEHGDIPGVQKLMFSRKTRDFMNLAGQLRFQQRWSQTPRIPETSVAGHMLIVALLSYMMALEAGACEKRRYNDFFGGLFHDMPEVLTRDIISPVKNSIEGIGGLIKDIEDSQMEKVIYPLLPEGWVREVRYFTENEFSKKIAIDGKPTIIGKTDDLGLKYNSDAFSPVDGDIIEFCDKFAAYMEAYLAIRHGFNSHYLEDGYNQLYKIFKGRKPAGLNAGYLFDYFRLDP